MRLLPLLVAAALGVGAAALAACGGDRSSLIPPDSAQNLRSALEDVEQAVGNGDCDASERAVSRTRGALVNLPDSVDDRLVARLERGIENLEERAAEECQQQDTTTTTMPTTTTTTPTDTTPTDTTPTDTTPTDTTPTEPTPTEPTPTDEEPTEPAPPADTSGGVTPDANGGSG